VNASLPSLLCSTISAGCGDHGLCGMGFRPSARKSAPVSAASTPGSAKAFSAAIARISACACGERSTWPNTMRGSTMSST